MGLPTGFSVASMRIEKRLRVINPQGLHARPAGLVVDCASQFTCDIRISVADCQVDAKSMIDMLLIAAPEGAEAVVTAEGSDAAEAVEAIESLFLVGFHEMEPNPSS